MSKLLLVEDDQSIVSSLSDYLGNEGFKIENAPGQKEAIEKLDSDQYDIALVDIQLSNGNGFSVCSAIKELEHHGYVERHRLRNEYGFYGDTEYIIREVPLGEEND